MRRIFIEINEIANCKNNTILLDKENANYIKNVLRLRDDSSLAIFDGANEYEAKLNGKYLHIQKTLRSVENEIPCRLAIAAIKQPRFEWLVEKATEIGCTEIFILETKFSQNTIRNYDRLRKITIEAARQCNRISIPKIHVQTKLNQFIANIDNSWAFAHPYITDHDCDGEVKIMHSPNINTLEKHYRGIIIGPEGGFDTLEEKILEKHCKKVALSSNILRAETAAIVSLTHICNSLLF